MRALFVDHSPRREQAPRSSRSNKMAPSSSNHSTGSSSGGGAAARRAMRAKAQSISMQPATNRRRNMAFMKYGDEDRRSETSMHRTREHARLLAQRMSDDSASPQHGLNSFGNFATFESNVNHREGGDNDSTFHSQASSFFDEDPFGSEAAVPLPPVDVMQHERVRADP